VTQQTAASKPFDPGAYGPVFGPLLQDAPLNELGPGSAIAEMEKQLQAVSLKTAFAPHAVVDRTMAQACLAGLWLRYDFLDQSHGISQEIHNPSGSFWHGIMHRREPDYDNAKYWFRRVGRHHVFAPLYIAAKEISELTPSEPGVESFRRQTEWDSFAFVDLIKESTRRPACEASCRLVQRREWELLFDFCYRAAIGKIDHD
jgi:hypothetical protein